MTKDKSLDFVIFRTLEKMFDTFSQVISNECRNLPLMTDIIRKQNNIFLVRYCAFDNLVCKVFASHAERYK